MNEPAPQTRFSALALIRRWVDDRSQWLVHRADRSQPFRLIEAQRLESESFREAIMREVAWQLDLDRHKDMIASSVPRLHLELMLETQHGCADSSDCWVDIVEFYLIQTYGKQGREKLEGNPHIEWWAAEQLMTENSLQDFDARQRLLLQKADILNEESHNG